MGNNKWVLIGYSGHAYVVYDICKSMGDDVVGYCENEMKTFDPYGLPFFGSEKSDQGIQALKAHNYFIAIGSNAIRKKIQDALLAKGLKTASTIIHSSALIGSDVKLGYGTMVAQNAVLNAQASIGNGVVCNTSCIIEHEVEIGDYAFIAPNATLLGGAKIGANCFIGANATIIQNVKIGENSVVGAGSVVLKDIPANSKVVGNPSRFI